MTLRSAVLLVLSFCCFASTGFTEGDPKGDKMTEKATFAGGCFWCMQPAFDKLEGVLSTTVGYAGGAEKNPTYHEVSAGKTGHAEVIQVAYDPEKISYESLLKVFWHNVDPTVKNRQFCDVGKQYRTAVFYHNENQKLLVEKSKKEILEKALIKGDIHTEIAPFTEFYPGEEYHQKYYQKNPVRYNSYRTGCGRDRRLAELWGKDATGH
jgi:peptide-methionine (S)-S-oxide reductase